MENRGYSMVKTDDGTYSLYANEYSQAMHSISGAYQEAVLKHVYPSRILECQEKELFVLDIGFGIGYNALALINEFIKKKTDQKLNIISLEKDFSYKTLMNNISFNDERDAVYSRIRNCITNCEINMGKYSLKIKSGDARDSIKTLNNYFFDAVFHDPYSPSKNPELWSVDFFEEVYNLMKENAVLTTYSSALQIRMALIEAGFKIGAGPSAGRKKEGTLASRGGNIHGLSHASISELKSNVKSTPYMDYGLKGTREEIINRRTNIMKKRRSSRLCF